MPTLVEPPFPIFYDVDGDPLENGYIYIGVANLNPIANPLQAYWDAEMTVPAAQPIRTKGGYPVLTGTPKRIYVPANYSILVKNKNQTLVYSNLDSTDYFNSPSGGIILKVDTIADLRNLVPTTDEGYPVHVQGYYAIGDGGGGPIRYWSNASVATDNGGSIIRPTAIGAGSPGRWLFTCDGPVNIKWYGARDNGSVGVTTYDSISHIQAAYDAHETISVPKGFFYISAPILAIENHGVLGESRTVGRSGYNPGVVYAPNGFMINNNIVNRTGVCVKDIAIVGNSTAIAFNGTFGGFFEGLWIDYFTKAVKDELFYLCYWDSCKIDHCATGFEVGAANGTSIRDCWFGSSVIVAIDNYNWTTTVAGATNNSYPMVIDNCNFNIPQTSVTLLKLRGIVSLNSCYFELLSGNNIVMDSLIKYYAGRFDEGFFTITNCEVNTRGNITALNSIISIFGNNAAGSPAKNIARISGNRFLGVDVLVPIVELGRDELGTGASAIVGYIESDGNNEMRVEYNSKYQNINNFRYELSLDTELDITAAAFVSLPWETVASTSTLGSGVSLDALPSSIINIPSPGFYKLRCRITYRIIAALNTGYRGVEAKITVNGDFLVGILDSIISLDVANKTYRSVVLEYTGYFTNGDDLVVQARNGQFIYTARFEMVRLDHVPIVI